MTGKYVWNPMPHKVDINCPLCGGHAVFEFAEVVKIELKKDIPYFKASNCFEYKTHEDYCGHKWHGATYYASLNGGSTATITNLPDGYKPEDWDHSKYLIRSHNTDNGAFTCGICQTRKVYVLNWPSDAFYSLSYKGKSLWAFNRESLIDLRDFIESNDRNTERYKWASFLLHVPTIFKKKSARADILKQINRMLEFNCS
ncbi:hypothetical protein [Alkanindiges illinoisensis]|uniref:Uncharacterized protein n=1 Tax=Alkanindiges illinoisensis TaxID=197183 RepID=A0A4Y7X924_9GAMM|nr:hypothetical protein [Alkanindiges illinoisensis]TEU23082.1 hypothetical protein E2B99_14405 [Alkanindiges illinoisensis]